MKYHPLDLSVFGLLTALVFSCAAGAEVTVGDLGVFHSRTAGWR